MATKLTGDWVAFIRFRYLIKRHRQLAFVTNLLRNCGDPKVGRVKPWQPTSASHASHFGALHFLASACDMDYISSRA